MPKKSISRTTIVVGIASCTQFLAITPEVASAQAFTPVVDVCTGVSLPRSALTNYMGDANGQIVSPLENYVNGLLGIVDPLNLVLSPLSVDVSTILSNAEAGAPISVDVLDSNGAVVSPGNCNLTGDGYTLNTEAGIAFGGNAITGLGANGQTASAGEIDSIAIGNNAATSPLATSSVAIGTGASATASNSVALGAGSVADRGPQIAYSAPYITGTADAVGSVSVGSAGNLRQITNVAPGTAASDAATVGQVQGALAAAIAGSADAVQYDDGTHTTVTLDGAGGTTITNLANGTVAAGSSDAVNGSQLYGVQQQVTTNTTAIANMDVRIDAVVTDIVNLDARVTYTETTLSDVVNRVTVNEGAVTVLATNITNLDQRVTLNETAITNLQASIGNSPIEYVSDADGTTPSSVPTDTARMKSASGGAVRLTNVADGQVAPGSTDAVNGSQLAATNQAVASNTTIINQHTVEIAGLTDAVQRVPVQYSNAATPAVPNGGIVTNDVTLVGANSLAPVSLHNVGPGSLPNDAVNVSQLLSGIDQAVYTANSYTDARIAELGFNLGELREASFAGTAGALAAAGLPQVTSSSGNMIAGAVAHYRGQTAFAIGLSSAIDDGQAVLKVNGTIDTHGYAGVSAGAGFAF